jgi:TRAP-type C4-dicarboxylate transport system substrate-binding protein
MRKSRMLVMLGGLCFFLAFTSFPVTDHEVNAAQVTKVVWKMQSVFPPPEEVFDGAGVPGVYGQFMELARRVEKRTNGHFQIKVYLPGELVKLNEAPEALIGGAIDALGCNAMYYTGVWPEGFIAGNIPLSTKSYEEFQKIYTETAYVDLLRRGHAKKNVYWLCNIESASANLMTTFPLRTIADFKGKKIAASGPRAVMIKNMGGAPVNVASSEMYTALQRGMVDGITYPPYCGISYKFFEVTKYVIWPGMTAPSMGEILVNLDSWKKLPVEYQNIINKEASDLFIMGLSQWGPKKDKLSQDGATKYGVQNIYLTEDVYKQMRGYSVPLWDGWAKLSPENAELVKIFKTYCGIEK